ncbi:zinc finger BED domain-containing protein 5-like [Styela clava]
MKVKRPYTELERVVLPCLEIVADLIHGGTKAVDKVKKIAVSDTTVWRRCAVISADLKEQLIQKLLEASSFGIQLDESTDISSESQLMVFCRFPDIKSNRIVEHYLFCQPVEEKATAEAIFNKINEFFEEEGLDWSKCKSVTTDGAAAMRGSQKGLIERIKRKSPECIGIHCILHREALVTKKLELNAGDASEVRWLSRGKVLSRVFELREQLGAYYTERGDQKANRFRNIYWIAKLAYMASIFDRLNQVNVSLQGKGGDIFRSTSKINALKMKIQLWKNNASSRNFIDFPLLSQYLKESGWEFEDVSTINTMVMNELPKLCKNKEATETTLN